MTLEERAYGTKFCLEVWTENPHQDYWCHHGTYSTIGDAVTAGESFAFCKPFRVRRVLLLKHPLESMAVEEVYANHATERMRGSR